MEGYADEEILAMLKSPNDKQNNEALRYLYKKHFKYIASFVYKNNGKDTDAEDTFQDAIIVLVNQIKSDNLALRASIKTYLYSIARNIWLKSLRNRKKEVPILEEHEFIPLDEKGIEKELEFDELTKGVQAVISLLGKECQEILRYFYLEKVRIKEIMSLMNYGSEQSVKNKKWRCIQKLKDKLRQNRLFDDYF